jgi:hypothetical protein
VLFEAYGGEAVTESSVFEWLERFKDGRENVVHDERSGRTRFHRTDENVEKVQNPVHSDRRLSIAEAYDVEILERLREVLRRNRPELRPTDWISTTTVLQPTRHSLTSSFWPRKSVTELEHPPFSSDLAPNDFRLLTKMKFALKGRRFQDIEDIQKIVTTALKAIS